LRIRILQQYLPITDWRLRSRQKHDIDRVRRADHRRVPTNQSAVGSIRLAEIYRIVTSAASHLSADHQRGGFRAVLLHNDEDLAPTAS
jgi:hypothetical protein